jgi:hypothetical protein
MQPPTMHAVASSTRYVTSSCNTKRAKHTLDTNWMVPSDASSDCAANPAATSRVVSVGAGSRRRTHREQENARTERQKVGHVSHDEDSHAHAPFLE